MPPKAKLPMVDINSATREELVDIAGLTPSIADAILDRRAAVGSFVSHDALQGAAGITDEAIEQIRNSTRVVTKAGVKALEVGATMASEAGDLAKGSVETAARLGAEATDRAARVGLATAENVNEFAKAQAGLAREAGTKAGEAGTAAAATGRRLGEAMADRGAEIAHQSGQLGIAWFSFWPEQIREGWLAAMALGRCRSLPEVVQVQTDFWRKSMERSCRLFGAALPQGGLFRM